jgi:hypothetical protein
MKNETYDEEPGLGGDFPGREKQDVFPAASGMDLRRPGKSPPNLGAGA